MGRGVCGWPQGDTPGYQARERANAVRHCLFTVFSLPFLGRPLPHSLPSISIPPPFLDLPPPFSPPFLDLPLPFSTAFPRPPTAFFQPPVIHLPLPFPPPSGTGRATSRTSRRKARRLCSWCWSISVWPTCFLPGSRSSDGCAQQTTPQSATSLANRPATRHESHQKTRNPPRVSQIPNHMVLV